MPEVESQSPRTKEAMEHEILCGIVEETPGAVLLAIPAVGECLARHFQKDVQAVLRHREAEIENTKRRS